MLLLALRTIAFLLLLVGGLSLAVGGFGLVTGNIIESTASSSIPSPADARAWGQERLIAGAVAGLLGALLALASAQIKLLRRKHTGHHRVESAECEKINRSPELEQLHRSRAEAPRSDQQQGHGFAIDAARRSYTSWWLSAVLVVATLLTFGVAIVRDGEDAGTASPEAPRDDSLLSVKAAAKAAISSSYTILITDELGVPYALGSAFAVNREHIVTNAHVFESGPAWFKKRIFVRQAGESTGSLRTSLDWSTETSTEERKGIESAVARVTAAIREEGWVGGDLVNDASRDVESFGARAVPALTAELRDLFERRDNPSPRDNEVYAGLGSLLIGTDGCVKVDVDNIPRRILSVYAEQGFRLVSIVPTRMRTEKELDLALIRVEGLNAEPIVLSDTPPQVGDRIWAIGSPEGLEGSLSEGVVSAIRRDGTHPLIQMTAPVSSGSSGGPVLDGRGQLVGVAVSQSRSGQNINFSIHVDTLRLFLNLPSVVRVLMPGQEK